MRNAIEILVLNSGVVDCVITVSPDEFADMGYPSEIELSEYNGSLDLALFALQTRSKLFFEPIHLH